MPTDPSAGPSSPSPAELERMIDDASGEIVGQLRSAGVNARYFHGDDFVRPILSALVRSVEERTLREAAKDLCGACMGLKSPGVVHEQEATRTPVTIEWPSGTTIPAGTFTHRVRNVDGGEWRVECLADVLWSRLASLKETRER